MKKLVTLLAVLSFAVGLNANNLKEEIYNSNPEQFDKLVQTLNAIQKEQSEKLAQAYEQKQINKAIKAIFSNKEILRNFNSAVVKDGQIVKLSNAKDADGISFWHEHSSSLQDTPPANTCRVYDPSWGTIANDTPCGLLKYQMTSNSSYANQTPRYIHIRTCIDDPSVISSFEAIDPHVSEYNVDFVENYCFASSSYTSLMSLFTSNQVIDEYPYYAGAFNGDVTFYRPSGFDFYVYNSNFVNTFYSQTEFSDPNNNMPIYTLRSGNYIPLLVLPYRDPNDNNKDFYVLKWFNLRVENYYLGDVSVNDHNQPAGVNIGFNNREITINLAETIDPSNKVYELYDISGKMVDRQNLLGHQTTISMPNVSSGIYVIRVQGKNLSATQKIAYNK